MPVTSIQQVVNASDRSLLFINTEWSANNREIPARGAKLMGNCWVPWCGSARNFPAHHLHIIDTASDKVLWYIWQQRMDGEDLVRASQMGFEDPVPISGEAGVGKDRTLLVDQQGIQAIDFWQ